MASNTIVERIASGGRTVDITPTWRACLPVFLLAYEGGTPEGRKLALEELRRMADAADEAVADAKRRNAAP